MTDNINLQEDENLSQEKSIIENNIKEKQDILKVKGIFEKFVNNESTEKEELYLNKKGFLIKNTGSDIILFDAKLYNGHDYDKNTWITSIPYYTVGNVTESDWDRVDYDFKLYQTKGIENIIEVSGINSSVIKNNLTINGEDNSFKSIKEILKDRFGKTKSGKEIESILKNTIKEINFEDDIENIKYNIKLSLLNTYIRPKDTRKNVYLVGLESAVYNDNELFIYAGPNDKGLYSEHISSIVIRDSFYKTNKNLNKKIAGFGNELNSQDFSLIGINIEKSNGDNEFVLEDTKNENDEKEKNNYIFKNILDYTRTSNFESLNFNYLGYNVNIKKEINEDIKEKEYKERFNISIISLKDNYKVMTVSCPKENNLYKYNETIEKELVNFFESI